MKKMLRKSDDDAEVRVKKFQGEDFEQVKVSHNSESTDPRVGGTTIMFDSRLDQLTHEARTSDIDAFMKAK